MSFECALRYVECRMKRNRSRPVSCASFRNRQAFTLVEVILAIGLSAALLTLLTGAIGLYIIRIESSRASVENSQLARSVVRLVADDLRSAATVYEQDISVTQQLAASQASFDVEQIDDPAAESSGNSMSGEDSAETRRPVGLFGDAIQVQFDMLKSRTIDPSITFGSGELQSPPSTLRGVTTVRYFVTAEGLTRQEASRDVELWEERQASTATLDASSRVIAPEVTEMRLLYSDGEQSLDTWDSEEQEGTLPLAVEVQLTFREQTVGGDAADESTRTYRVVVALPSANPVVESESQTTDAATEL